VSDSRASVAVIVEEIAVGDAIPLHRHRIDEVLVYESGEAEVRLDDDAFGVRAGDIVIVPAGAAHGTRNVGGQVVRVRAFFPSHRIDITYLERNPAPGTEGDAPQPAAVYDTRTGEIEPLG
jgi:quercetin dioxygenase-like cupin family protein